MTKKIEKKKVAPIKTTAIQISEEGSFTTTADCFRFDAGVTKATRKKWVDDRQLFMLNGIVYTPVITAGKGLYWMACITGTLYNNCGDCLSGDHSLNLDHMIKDQEGCSNILLGKK